MKNIIYSIILTLSFSFFIISCDKDLNVPPQNILTSDAVFASESAVNAYMASLYNDLPIEDFNFSRSGFNTWANGGAFIWDLSDESIANLTDNPNSIGDGTWLQWWAYNSVRNVNDFIAKIKTSKFTTDQVKGWLGEALFIRAYYYFGMVKRYGGVPLITDVQTFKGDNLTELQVPRDPEKKIYDFVGAQLDSAVLLLAATSDKGKANKFVAYALKSRVMLYAASIAKYGNVQLNGIVGIASSDANNYWQLAYDAAKKVMGGGYTLYNKSLDKTQNFKDLFFDNANPEVILAKYYQYPQKTHSFDLWALPHSVRSSAGYSSRINPTLELAEQYEYIDGSNGKLKISDGGKPIEYAKPGDLFLNKDPRFAATIIAPFDTWKTSADPAAVIDVQAGIIDNGQIITSATNNLYNGLPVTGENGIGGGGGEVTQTGFYIRKFLNPNYARSFVVPWSSTQPYIDIRYAEVLLNYAEASVELGKTTDAMDALNQVRTRAGIMPVAMADITLDKVRHERQVELAFEAFRYWDIRRWRIADKILNNVKPTALLPYLQFSNRKYVFQTTPVGFTKTFLPQMYYERIDPAEISKNPNLVQNPGY
jgi:hypothetical protein